MGNAWGGPAAAQEDFHQAMCFTVYLFSQLRVVGVHTPPIQVSWLFGARLGMAKKPDL